MLNLARNRYGVNPTPITRFDINRGEQSSKTSVNCGSMDYIIPFSFLHFISL